MTYSAWFDGEVDCDHDECTRPLEPKHGTVPELLSDRTTSDHNDIAGMMIELVEMAEEVGWTCKDGEAFCPEHKVVDV